jgi:hypothetical protein
MTVISPVDPVLRALAQHAIQLVHEQVDAFEKGEAGCFTQRETFPWSYRSMENQAVIPCASWALMPI